jgi:plasmid maintenance system antidote protein VapI
MEITDRYLATNLGAVMEKQGRQNVWLAERLGVSRSFITMVISGQRTISGELADKISGIFDIPLFLLFELSRESKMTSEKQEASAA